MADGSVRVGNALVIMGDPAFQRNVLSDLSAIAQTPTGAELLAALNATGKTVRIVPASKQSSCEASPDDPDSSVEAYYLEYSDAVKKPGKGTNPTIEYDPKRFGDGPTYDDDDLVWSNVPAAISLAHELIHAYQFTTGTAIFGDTKNDSRRDPAQAGRFQRAGVPNEVRTVGVPKTPYEDGKPQALPFTENKIRSEWKPKPLPKRPYY